MTYPTIDMDYLPDFVHRMEKTRETEFPFYSPGFDVEGRKRLEVRTRSMRFSMLSRRYLLWLAALLFTAVLLAACVGLPEHARPRLVDAPGREYDGGGEFGYRPLSVADFQAGTLPDASAAYDHDIQARSCISLRTTSDTAARISQGSIDGLNLFVGRFKQIRFEAVFAPGCSWWSSQVRAKQVGYVLQHEQIHFALTELVARRLNREKRNELEQFMAIGASLDEVQTQLSEKVREVTRQAMELDLARHTSFDEETSLLFDPAAQQRWYVNIQKELREAANLPAGRSREGQ